MANIFLTLDTSFSMSKTWIVSLFRGLFAFFDSLIYTLISWLFRAVFNLANFELYGVYEDMMDRVYVILGIFMLFKITVSLITYLADPDKINDKEQGISKLITRIITVMVMLIGLPTFFSLMTEAQNKILPVIPRIIINSPTTLSSDDVTGISEKLATTMLNGFAHVKTGCSNAAISKPFDFLKVVNDSCESADDSNSDAYAYDYLPIVSTITGVIMIYVIFSFCISVAIRAFKLIILRSISPIPVLSYIDPKAEKDGGAFSTWKKTFFSTWLELFINLGLIYFIIYIIDMLLSGDMYKGFFDGVNFLDGVFLLAFLLIGLLMFAKQAPQFIFDALGIKNKGNFTRMLGLGATAIGAGGTVASAIKNRNDYSREHGGLNAGERLKNIGASLFNGAMSAANGGSAILSADKPTLRTGFDSQQKYNSNMLSNISSGIGLGNQIQAVGTSILFGTTPLDDMDRQISSAKAKSSTAKQLKEYAIGEGKKKTAHIQTDYSVNGHVQHISLDDWNQAVALANSSDGDGYIHFSDGTMVAAASSLANKIQGDLEERAGYMYSLGTQASTAYTSNNQSRITELQKLMAGFGVSNNDFEKEFSRVDQATGKVVGNDKFEDPGALDAFRETLAASLGTTVEGLKEYNFNGRKLDLYNDPSQIKTIEKSSQTESFRIENSNEYSEAKKIYGKNKNT